MKVGIVGATGQVGGLMKTILEERDFPISNMRFFASPESEGKKLSWGDESITVENAMDADYSDLDIALLSAGANASLKIAEDVGRDGVIVIDNSSAWRMDDNVPLIVSEVNGQKIKDANKNIIANPNCTTMAAMPVVWPLHNVAGLTRITASTYQAVSGRGIKGTRELRKSIKGMDKKYTKGLELQGYELEESSDSIFPSQVLFNVLPLCGEYAKDGSGETDEEQKFRNESRKILDIPDLKVASTCVRVPVFTGHSLSLTLEFQNKITAQEALKILADADGVEIDGMPTPLKATGEDSSYVGRVRENLDMENSLSMFISCDNLRKGAALNTVQIAELLLSGEYMRDI